MAPRRVLIIVQNLPVPFDRRVWQEATTLQQNGYEVSVICPKGKGFDAAYEVIDGVHIYRHPLPFEASGARGYALEYASSLFWEFFLACKISLTRGFDAIHACNPPDNIFLIGGFFKYLFRKKFLFDHHDICPELFEAKFGHRGFLYRLMVWCERRTFRLADMSIATNESYRRIAIERGGMASDKVVVVRSGPSLERMRILPPVPAHRMGKRFLVGYVGVMGAQEGIPYLLEAARIITQEWGRDDVHFTIVGGGSALEMLQQLARDMRLHSVVNFTGRVSDDAMLEVLNTADICVNPDEVNAMNNLSTMNKIMEYMALGKPIVQFDVVEGKFSAGEASLYAKPNDARDFAAKIITLLDNPEQRATMGNFGRMRVETELAWPHEAPKLLAAYAALFAGVQRTPLTEGMNVVMIGAFPEDLAHINGGVQASVIGLSRVLKQRSEIRSITGISLPTKATKNRSVTHASLDGISVTYLTTPFGWLASSSVHLPRILRCVARLTNPIVHVHGTGLLQCALLTLLRLKNTPHVWTLHGIAEKELLQKFRSNRTATHFARYLFYRGIERVSLCVANQVIVDTPYVREALPPSAKITVIPQGIFCDEFTKAAARAQPLILSLGAINPRKGHHLTIDAFTLLRTHIPDAQLVIAGALTRTEYHQQLLQQIAALGLHDCVSLRVNLPRLEILELFTHARLVALHSQEESQGIALCEALAAGIPVVATRVGGIPYVVTEGADGLLVDYGDAAAFAEAMQRLLTDATLYDHMAAHARSNAQRFDWNGIAAKVAGIYSSALSS